MLTDYELNLAMRLCPQGFENLQFDDERFTKAFLAAFDNAKQAVLCIGEAGSGKTQILKAVAAHYGDRALVMTMTGMGAYDLMDNRTKARTIHGGLGLPVRPFYNETDVYRKPIEAMRGKDVIIIDEISLINSNLLNTIVRHKMLADEGRRRKIRLLAFGDPGQCAPVLKESELAPVLRDFPDLRKNWAFTKSEMFRDLKPELHVLKKVYRQKDPDFRAVLGRARTGTLTDYDIKYLNEHVQASPGRHGLVLATTLKEVREINEEHMKLLLKSQVPVAYDAEFEFGDTISGMAEHIELCRGERVSVCRNHYDPEGNLVCANGTLGTVVDFRYEDGSMLPVVRTDYGDLVVVPFVEFEEAELRKVEDGKYDYVPTAKARMLPLVPSWSTTYHKAQGKTLDEVYLRIPDRRPMEGLLYMGMSRVRSLKGLALSSPVSKEMFIVPEYAKEFLMETEPSGLSR